MIKLTPFATGPRDHQMNTGVVIREVADVEIVGYICAAHCAVESNALRFKVLPANIQFLTVDIVVSSLPPILAGRKFEFINSPEAGRIVHPLGWGLSVGRARPQQVHLNTCLDVQFFKSLIGRRVKIVGTEIAVQDPGVGTFCWAGPLMSDLLGLPGDSTLRASLSQINQDNIIAGRSECHCISVHQVEPAPFFLRRSDCAGKEAMGHFTAAASAASAAGAGAVNGAQSKIDSNNKAKADGLRAQKNDAKTDTMAAAAQKYLDGGD